MKKFRYTILTKEIDCKHFTDPVDTVGSDMFSDVEEFNNNLLKLGDEGWELVDILQIKDNNILNNKYKVLFFFKREVQ